MAVLMDRSLLDAIGVNNLISFGITIFLAVSGWLMIFHLRSVADRTGVLVSIALSIIGFLIGVDFLSIYVLLMSLGLVIGVILIATRASHSRFVQIILGSHQDILKATMFVGVSLCMILTFRVVIVGFNVGMAVAKGPQTIVGRQKLFRQGDETIGFHIERGYLELVLPEEDGQLYAFGEIGEWYEITYFQTPFFPIYYDVPIYYAWPDYPIDEYLLWKNHIDIRSRLVSIQNEPSILFTREEGRADIYLTHIRKSSLDDE